jgi:hypothetical protein
MNYEKSLRAYYSTAPKLVSIMSDKLVSGMDYQRKIKYAHVKEIAENFAPTRFSPPIVLIRDGKYHLEDGQHRVLALVSLNKGKPTPVWCLAFEDQPEESGARIVAEQDKGHLNQSEYVSIYASAKSGNETARDFLDANRILKIKLLAGDMAGVYYFNAVKTLYTMFEKYGRATYIRVMTMICSTWGNKPGTHDARVLKAVFAFDGKYKAKYRVSVFQSKLKNTDMQQLIVNTRAGNLPITDGLVSFMYSIYNKGLSEENRL